MMGWQPSESQFCNHFAWPITYCVSSPWRSVYTVACYRMSVLTSSKNIVNLNVLTNVYLKNEGRINSTKSLLSSQGDIFKISHPEYIPITIEKVISKVSNLPFPVMQRYVTGYISPSTSITYKLLLDFTIHKKPPPLARQNFQSRK